MLWFKPVTKASPNAAGRFMPRVEIVQKHNTAARRLYIRGHNGKIYPYLVMNDACLTESRREERVLQLLRLLNPCLEKRKETTKRHLFFTGTAEREICLVFKYMLHSKVMIAGGFFEYSEGKFTSVWVIRLVWSCSTPLEKLIAWDLGCFQKCLTALLMISSALVNI